MSVERGSSEDQGLRLGRRVHPVLVPDLGDAAAHGPGPVVGAGREGGDAGAAAARDFCLRLVEATARYAAAYKPNSAFFEQFGAAGWEALKDVIGAIAAFSDRAGTVTPVILDAKRGAASTKIIRELTVAARIGMASSGPRARLGVRPLR